MTTSAPETPIDRDDAVLLAGLRGGRAPAFEAVMRRHNRLLFRAARGISPDDASAQDAVQETWLRAFLALDGFRGESSLATWLTRIAIHEALTQQRRLGRFVPLDDECLPDEESAMAATEDASGAPAAAGSPELDLERARLRRRLEAAIDLLPPIYRVVFILRAVQGLDVAATAQALRVSSDVVKTRYSRARAMLRGHLAGPAAAELPLLHDFRGERCDALVGSVLAALRSRGVIRDH